MHAQYAWVRTKRGEHFARVVRRDEDRVLVSRYRPSTRTWAVPRWLPAAVISNATEAETARWLSTPDTRIT